MYLPSQNEQSLNKSAVKSLTNTDLGSYMLINSARIIDTDWDISIFGDSLELCNQKDAFFNSFKIRFIILWTCLCKFIILGSFITCRYCNLKLFVLGIVFWVFVLRFVFVVHTPSLIFFCCIREAVSHVMVAKNFGNHKLWSTNSQFVDSLRVWSEWTLAEVPKRTALSWMVKILTFAFFWSKLNGKLLSVIILHSNLFWLLKFK